jgi:predicted permease
MGASLRTRLRALFRRQAMERELDEEMRFHLDRLVAENLAAGMAPDQARRAALRSFGGLEQASEECRDARGTTLIEGLWRDVRHGVRVLRRSAGFTLVVLLSLGLGVGANAAIFSLVDQVLLRRLPARDPQSLVLLSWKGTFVGKWWGRTTDGDLLTHALYRELTAAPELGLWSGLFARKPTVVNLAVGELPEPVAAELVSGSFFSELGAGAALGRVLDAGDDLQPGAHPVVVLSFDYWKNRLGAPPDIVGRKVLVNSHAMTVVGVAAAGFRGIDPLEAPSLWIPLMMQSQASPEFAGWLADHRARWLHVFGRLAPGISATQAQAGLQPWFKATLEADTRRADWPRVTAGERESFLASVLEVKPAGRGRSEQRGVLEGPLLILMAATGLVLLLACLNVANLLVARAFARRRELAVRAALGASAGRIVRELAVQVALLAVAGAATGLALAPLVSRALLSFLPETVTLEGGLNARVFLFALGAALVTAVLFGVAPALLVSRTRPMVALKEQSAALAGGVRLRRLLVVGQIALALALLIGAGLFVRTLGSLRGQAEVVAADLLTFRVDASRGGYGADQAKRRVREVLAAVRALPEVASAGLARQPLMSGGGMNMRFTVGPGDARRTGEVQSYFVGPGLFAALGVPMVLGADFPEAPAEVEPGAEYRSAIVSESFARRYLQGRNPIGARLGFGVDAGVAPAIEIVGVVKEFHYRGLRSPEVQVFFPALEKPLQGATFFVRTRGRAESAFSAIGVAVRGVDPTLPVLGLRTLDAQVDSALGAERFLAILATTFAGLATLLAILGLHGVMSFTVARRTREIGIRLALGASPAGAVGLIVREAAAMVGAGIALGLPAAWSLGRLARSQLYGVSASDGATVAGATVLVALVALFASALPALRASAVTATEALRVE